MSEYFRILNRVEEEHPDSDLNAGSKPVAGPDNSAGSQRRTRARRSATEVRPAYATDQAVEGASTASPTVESHDRGSQPEVLPEPPRRSAGQTQARKESFARAFDNLRAIAVDSGLRSIVVAPCSGREAVEDVIAGLATEANRHELQTFSARLRFSDGRYVIGEHTRFLTNSASLDPEAQKMADPISFRLNAGTLPAELTGWIEAAESACDLLIIHGPALGHNVDAALVGRGTDGVILVIEPHMTTHEDLRAAVERARSVHCNILGIVANGTRDELPAWMRQLAG